MDGMMVGVTLPGNSTVKISEFRIPSPGFGQVLVKTKSSTICGSDIRAIYREHLGKGPEKYQNVIAGHEPSGIIIEAGKGLRKFGIGDRVIVYHISGCGICHDCRMGYMISCSSKLRAAYGWQKDGGMAEYILADEKDLIALPDELTYTDGAQIACGFGTVYEALEKIGICGDDSVLVVGLGPVGLAALMLSKAMGANMLVGVDSNPDRIELAKKLKLLDYAIEPKEGALDELKKLTRGKGFERCIDCSGNEEGRLTAVKAARQWGKIALVGEGNKMSFSPSPDIIHEQKTIYGSWVTSIWKMEDLVEKLVKWKIHPEDLVTHRFPINKADEAYKTMASGNCGKVAVVFDEEIKD